MRAVQGSLIETIFEETSGVHQRITLKMMQTLGNPLSLARYAVVLQRMLGLYLPLEKQFEFFAVRSEWRELACPLDERKKVHLLQKDLAVLGISTAEQNRIPLCEWPLLESEAILLGALWVVEGATFGGQATARRLEAALGINVNTGSAFFRSYGENRVKPMWERYCEALNAFVTRHSKDAGIIRRTVADIFSLSENWLFPEEEVPLLSTH